MKSYLHPASSVYISSCGASRDQHNLKNQNFVSQLCALHLTSTWSSTSDMPAAGVVSLPSYIPGELRHTCTACSVVCKILVKMPKFVCIFFNIELCNPTSYVQLLLLEVKRVPLGSTP